MPRNAYRARGGIALTDAEGRVVERDLLRCCHCGYFWPEGLPEFDGEGRPAERGFCRNHMEPTCGAPGCVLDCVPLADGGAELEARQIPSELLLDSRELPAPVCCGHCRRWYQPVPGSGKRREWCVIHNGPLCGECEVNCFAH